MTSAAQMTRRRLLGAGLLSAVGMTCSEAAPPEPGARRGRIRQSVCPWCFEPMPLETLCGHAKRLGIEAVDLVEPEDWPMLGRYGLVCAIAASHSFTAGLADPANHEECLGILRQQIDRCAAHGVPNVITFSGLGGEIASDEGLAHTVHALKQVIRQAERASVNICLEPLNTRVDQHMIGVPGYLCDTVEWAVEVCDRVGSPRMKVLFDIFHIQIMQGDVIARIRQYQSYIAHYHTAGVPGRHEIDETQELNYPAIMRAILETDYDGFVAHEFLPLGDPVQSLEAAVTLCDV